MPKIEYVSKRFGEQSLRMIEHANAIIAEYQAEGYELTLRQLYYQFVSRDLIPNTQKAYKNLGSIVSDGRLAGLIDWDAIVDRTRNLQSNSHWDSPSEIIESCAKQFQIDKWEDQEYRPEVWIEKDALIGVIENVCVRNDVPYFSCRGYTSQSEVWAAGMRLKRYAKRFQKPVVIHLGDHDPSGIDMTRDVEDRLNMFASEGRVMWKIEVVRIALNMDQVRKYNPPPNPAKLTDTRATSYIQQHGQSSWELDALEPRVLDRLIEKTIHSFRDDKLWEKSVKKEKSHRNKLGKIAKELRKK